ncbi:MAG: PQQ-binding-like beta-propeller repeat protein [Candidatus Altiarchaeota archaeon]
MRRGLLVLIALICIETVSATSVYKQTPLWSQHVPGKVNSIKTLNNTILVGAENGVYSIDYNKRQLWFHPTGGSVTAIKVWNNTIAASSDGALVLLDTSTGRMLWERRIPGYVGYDSAIDANKDGILCGSMDGFVYMLDVNGTFKWKHLIGSYVTNVRLFDDMEVAVSDRQVYILDNEGKVRRNLDISGYIGASAITRDRIVVGMDEGGVYAYSPNGNVMWERNMSEYISAIDADVNVTVGTREKQLMRFTPDGELLWRVNTTESVIAIESRGDYVLASTRDNRVTMYGSGGTIRWYYETDGKASALSMNDRDVASGTTTGGVYYSKLPKRDVMASFMISAAIMLIAGAAIMVVYRTWK